MRPVDVDRPADPRDEGDGLRSLLASVPASAHAALAAVRGAASEALGGVVEVEVDAGSPTVPGRTMQVGRVAVTWARECPPVSGELRTLLGQACAWATLAVDRCDARRATDAAAEETATVTEVVEQLLALHDVDQLLLSIATRTMALLEADICGVLLVEGDEVRMRSCVGHRVIDTARLRMRRGQGVAGLVFETGAPAKVDRYVEDRTISRDFVGLAEREQTESALAVPLELPGEFLGVLEVWRRRPSVFTEQDVRRMVTLANFATIALRSAREHDEQIRTNGRLGDAHAALKHQVGVLGRTAELQQALLTTVLEGGGLPAIARRVATQVGCQVGIYDATGTRVAVHGGGSLPETMPPLTRAGRLPRRPGSVPPAARLQPVHSDGDEVGWVCLLPGGDEEEMLDAVAGQVAMACSLTLLRERAASRARREALNEVLWDLVQGPPEHRVAARARAQQMGVLLGSRLRVLHGHLENVDEIAVDRGWDTSRTDRLRRDVVRALRDREDGPRLALVGLRGDLVVAVAEGLDVPAARRLVQEIVTSIHAEDPGIRSSWGISRPHDDAEALPAAFNEARTALSASHRLGGNQVSLYEELGVVRLLLGSGSDPDLQTFVDDVTGPLVAYDRDNDGSLVRTLRAFFDADCSQRVAAEKLFVHHKTLRYRLERIKALTGLDLARHDDRMRADVALRLLQLGGGTA
ncbi:helix-turn-helix domain-containing protein [Actinomycetospora termitidis]|uniref:Helix-turn-helix domain-containing protein n=1 Tax=Actinomycetospora termitidis TaxID=3053470 RepID=A0ABT7MGA9_9PSEU|nr:helix-turn-helix domain-containing protein [Actinomycetospora sp. Odt1-22]MDL5159708.1 helix-turn-helix domain-containing protein [Actinomycetospora sp. Odt1-22]